MVRVRFDRKELASTRTRSPRSHEIPSSVFRRSPQRGPDGGKNINIKYRFAVNLYGSARLVGSRPEPISHRTFRERRSAACFYIQKRFASVETRVMAGPNPGGTDDTESTGRLMWRRIIYTILPVHTRPAVCCAPFIRYTHNI